MLSDLDEFWVQGFASLAPWRKELDYNQLASSFALLDDIVKHLI